MDNLREEFEAWWEESQSNLHHSNNGPFQCMAWKAWQASRAALVVDYPAACADDEYFIDGVFQPMRYERDVERALIAAGISVKEADTER